LIASLAVGQTIPSGTASTTDRSCVNVAPGDAATLCADASVVVGVEEPSIDPDASTMAVIQVAAQGELTTFVNNFNGLQVCPTAALTNVSIELARQIAVATARVAEAQTNMTAAIQQALANWVAHVDNFTQMIQLFNQTGTEPTGVQKIQIFIVGWVLQAQRRIIEIEILVARSQLALANFYIQVLTAEKAVVDALIAFNCVLPDRTLVDQQLLAVIVARKVVEFRLTQLAVISYAFRVRWTLLHAELVARARLIQARVFTAYSLIRAAWAARKAYFEDAVRRAVIAYLADQGVLTSVSVTITLDPLSVRIVFTRTPPPSEDLQRIRDYIRRVVKTILASLSGANEDTDIMVNVPTPSKKRQGGQQTYTVTGDFQGSASALAMSLMLLFAVFLARFF